MKILRQQVDPRTKLIMSLCLSSLGVIIQNAYILMMVLILSMMIASIFGSNLLSMFKRMHKMIGLVIMISIVQSIFLSSGKPLVSMGQVTLMTTGGLQKGIEFVLRMAIIIVSATIVTTSNSREMIQGLVQLKIPYEIAFMASIGIRFLPMLKEEVRDVMIAIQLRGIELEKIPLKTKIKIYSYLFMPIVASTIIKAQKLSIAMETRAFRAYPERTSYRVLKMSSLDHGVITLSLFLTTLLIMVYFIVY